MEVAVEGVLLLFCVLPILLFSFKMYKRRSQLPPGPAPWPFLGNFLQKDVLPLYKSYPKLIEKYGPIFTVWIGPKPLVVLCGYEVVKDALVDHAEEFGSRPTIPIQDRVQKGQGLNTRNEAKWKELRRFTISTLWDFGMGKKTMSERMQEEALCLVEEMAATQGKPFNPRRSITNSVSNVICSVLHGSRFDYKDEAFLQHLRVFNDSASFYHSFLGRVYTAIPKIMDYLPGQHNKVFADGEKLCALLREKVESHRQTLDPQNPRDYIDCFLMKMEKEKKSKEIFYSPEDLVMCMFAFSIAGTASTTNALLYSLVVMAKLPHIQAKVQKEIEAVVGPNRVPVMEDRERMPFTDAVIHETQRYQKASLETLPHAVTHHIEFRNYTIPKGIAIIPLTPSVHFDPLQWETPEKFNPDHFLDRKGQFRKRDAFMPFSAGKRACPGEALGRMLLFLFFSTLLQNFTFQLVGEAKNMDLMSLYAEVKTRKQCAPVRAIRRTV